MQRVSWLAIPVALAALMAAGDAGEFGSRSDSAPSALPSTFPSVFAAALPPTSFSTYVVAPVMDALEAEFKRDAIARARRAKAVYFQEKGETR